MFLQYLPYLEGQTEAETDPLNILNSFRNRWENKNTFKVARPRTRSTTGCRLDFGWKFYIFFSFASYGFIEFLPIWFFTNSHSKQKNKINWDARSGKWVYMWSIVDQNKRMKPKGIGRLWITENYRFQQFISMNNVSHVHSLFRSRFWLWCSLIWEMTTLYLLLTFQQTRFSFQLSISDRPVSANVASFPRMVSG